ncbi:HIT family protein [Actinophytocola sediminis]
MRGKRICTVGGVDCFVCAKHRNPTSMPGGPVAEDDLVVVSHTSTDAPGQDGSPVYLGHLIVEPRRHVAGLGDLTEDEAAAVGRWLARGAAALRTVAGAEHVYSMVVGHAVDHLHLHLIPRYPGTPREYWWTRLDEWPDAPLGDHDDATRLAVSLRAHLYRTGR